ncbi:MAG: hypothetical protein QG622_141 [Actinomycetota bacterium]|nr:hypothetical protein [Actinomycetota bacterium]
MLVLAALLGVGQVVVGQIRCVDAARAGARAAARGESITQVRGIAGALAPPGAIVGLVRAGGLVQVAITGSMGLPEPFPPVPWHCEAVSVEESS